MNPPPQSTLTERKNGTVDKWTHVPVITVPVILTTTTTTTTTTKHTTLQIKKEEKQQYSSLSEQINESIPIMMCLDTIYSPPSGRPDPPLHYGGHTRTPRQRPGRTFITVCVWGRGGVGVPAANAEAKDCKPPPHPQQMMYVGALRACPRIYICTLGVCARTPVHPSPRRRRARARYR